LFITLFLLFNIGTEFFLLTILITFFYLFYKKANLKFFLIIFFLFIFFLYFNYDFFNAIIKNTIEILNTRRRGYFLENFGLYQNNLTPTFYENYYSLSNLNFLSTIQLLKQFLYFLFSPLILSKLSIFDLMMFADQIFIIIILIYCYIRFKKNNKKIFFFWVFIILVNSFIYSLFIFNEGTMFRYRFIFLVYSIFAMNLELINKKSS
jgi:hypothetical protein